MSIVDAIILGIVEGVTEFLPVSSTGHLILASHLFGIPQSSFLTTFEIAIQLGAILAVVVLYFKSFFNFAVLKRLFVAFVPTALIGFVLYSVLKTYLLNSEMLVVVALALGGVALIAFELWHREDESATKEIEAIPYKDAFLIGLCQSVAIIPGVSRSAATIVGGLFLGISRIAIVEFSFLLAVPTMAAATGYDLLKSAHLFSSDQFLTLAVGFVVSFIVAMLAIKFLLSYVRKHTFIPFGVYRIIIAVLFFLFII
ncbi:undecaprenyl-diphosphate phosphatase [Candidatus Parcubacteria bacterium]|nr:MAG: undecaprenyl-diphosphate phosphatase [Candidatus Parcubacteria bacterium]